MFHELSVMFLKIQEFLNFSSELKGFEVIQYSNYWYSINFNTRGAFQQRIWAPQSKSTWNLMLYENHIFPRMGKIYYVEFQRYPLKFDTKYLAHKLKYVYSIQRWIQEILTLNMWGGGGGTK